MFNVVRGPIIIGGGAVSLFGSFANRALAAATAATITTMALINGCGELTFWRCRRRRQDLSLRSHYRPASMQSVAARKLFCLFSRSEKLMPQWARRARRGFKQAKGENRQWPALTQNARHPKAVAMDFSLSSSRRLPATASGGRIAEEPKSRGAKEHSFHWPPTFRASRLG